MSVGSPNCVAAKKGSADPLAVFSYGSVVDFSSVLPASIVASISTKPLSIEWYGAWLKSIDATDDAAKSWFVMRDGVSNASSVRLAPKTPSNVPGMTDRHVAYYFPGSVDRLPVSDADLGSWPSGLYRIGTLEGYYRFLLVPPQQRDDGWIQAPHVGAYFSERDASDPPTLLKLSCFTLTDSANVGSNPMVPLKKDTVVRLFRTAKSSSSEDTGGFSPAGGALLPSHALRGWELVAEMDAESGSITWEYGVPTAYVDVTNFKPGSYADVWESGTGTSRVRIVNSFNVSEPFAAVGTDEVLRWVQPSIWPHTIAVNSPSWHVTASLSQRGQAQCAGRGNLSASRLECLLLGTVYNEGERILSASVSSPAGQNTAPPTDFDPERDLDEDRRVPIHFIHFDRRTAGLRWTTVNPGWWGKSAEEAIGTYSLKIVVYDPLQHAKYPPPDPWFQPNASTYGVTLRITGEPSSFESPPTELTRSCGFSPINVPPLSSVKGSKANFAPNLKHLL